MRPEEVASATILIDWPVMAEVGLSVAVARMRIRCYSGRIMSRELTAGRGAAREVCDFTIGAGQVG